MLHFAIHPVVDSALERPETTDESLDNKGASGVRPARDDKWLDLARNLLELLFVAADRKTASPPSAEAAVSRNMSNS
jgi:hypothetical protein